MRECFGYKNVVANTVLGPPTRCYIHALHLRIAFLEHQLATTREVTESSLFSALRSGADEEAGTAPCTEILGLGQRLLDPISLGISNFKPDFQLRGACGLFSSGAQNEEDRWPGPANIFVNSDALTGGLSWRTSPAPGRSLGLAKYLASSNP